jgi:hypothetical protein
MTTILRIEHPVPDYDAWKQVFDSDPMGREKSGVRRYRIARAADDPNHVLIDLEFDSSADAEAMHVALQGLWNRVAGTLISDPRARIVEVTEAKEY